MKQIISAFLALALMMGSQGSGQLPVQNEEKPVEEVSAIGRATQNETAYANFSMDLLRANRVEGENVLISPLSVTLALGMTAMGAEGNTAEQFRQVMGMDKEGLRTYCQALMEDYLDLGGSTEINLVNSLWCDPDLTMDHTFVTTCQDSFDAELFYRDFQKASTVNELNSWVSRATRGKFPKVVESFNPDVVLALVNAVYLKNKFASPFETPTSNWTIDFQNADGTVAQPKGMCNGTRNERYLSHENGKGVVLPCDDDKLGLLLMLPDEGISLTDYLEGWDGGTVKGLLDGTEKTRVSLWVPKFKSQWDGELSKALKALGLGDAFAANTADFTSMGAGPLYISTVIHKATFELDEKGTEAAAVTVVGVASGAVMPPQDLVFLTFDHPFVYGIVDLERGTPLFLGTVENLNG